MNQYKFSDEPRVLKRVKLRLVAEEEYPHFNTLLKEKHYLSSANIAGRTLRYVAELDEEWVAILAFSASAFHLKPRDNWIGWNPRQHARRLDFVVNNSRFLVLPERERLPNLASRVLGMCLRRLSRDWEVRWGHPVFIVESFVDETRYSGVCYRACNFETVGATAGFGRSSRDFYHEHGKPKQLYMKELKTGARKLLCRNNLPENLAKHERQVAGPCPFRAQSLESLLERFKELKDKRRGHGLRHRQHFVLACATVAIMMGASAYKAIEDICHTFTQQQLRALGCSKNKKGKRVPPSDSTFFRVLSKVDTQHLDRIVGAWLLEQDESAIAQLAIDGKTLRGSSRINGKPLQLLSAVTHNLRLTLAQVAIEKKSNEITAFPVLLRSLPAADRVLITADAMNCQQESARVTTKEKGWDYILGLKGNQSGIFEKAKYLLDRISFPPDNEVQCEIDHGRLERRWVKRLAVTPEEIGLEGCNQIIAVRRERIWKNPKAGENSDETLYYVCSLTVDEITVSEVGNSIRGHWAAIENGTHHMRDVSLREDACRVGNRTAAHALASLRNLAIGIYELDKSRGRTKADSLASWTRRMTASRALKVLRE